MTSTASALELLAAASDELDEDEPHPAKETAIMQERTAETDLVNFITFSSPEF
jgi:hypothetical protein